jgi:hypothetical protein
MTSTVTVVVKQPLLHTGSLLSAPTYIHNSTLLEIHPWCISHGMHCIIVSLVQLLTPNLNVNVYARYTVPVCVWWWWGGYLGAHRPALLPIDRPAPGTCTGQRTPVGYCAVALFLLR